MPIGQWQHHCILPLFLLQQPTRVVERVSGQCAAASPALFCRLLLLAVLQTHKHTPLLFVETRQYVLQRPGIKPLVVEVPSPLLSRLTRPLPPSPLFTKRDSHLSRSSFLRPCVFLFSFFRVVYYLESPLPRRGCGGD